MSLFQMLSGPIMKQVGPYLSQIGDGLKVMQDIIPDDALVS